jgi:hypothetical protein
MPPNPLVPSHRGAREIFLLAGKILGRLRLRARFAAQRHRQAFVISASHRASVVKGRTPLSYDQCGGPVLSVSCSIANVTRRQIAAPAWISLGLKLIRMPVGIRFGVLGVAFDHQYRDSPDVDLSDHTEHG